jgi:hypothetical protein
MGEGSAATVREIEDTRERLDAQIRALEERMPEPARVAKKAAGIAVAGGATTTALVFFLKRRKKKRAKVEAPAGATVIKVFPDDFGKDMSKKIGKSMEDGEWKGWVAIAGSTWVVLRLLEIRQLRRMNRAILAGRPV